MNLSLKNAFLVKKKQHLSLKQNCLISAEFGLFNNFYQFQMLSKDDFFFRMPIFSYELTCLE